MGGLNAIESVGVRVDEIPRLPVSKKSDLQTTLVDQNNDVSLNPVEQLNIEKVVFLRQRVFDSVSRLEKGLFLENNENGGMGVSWQAFVQYWNACLCEFGINSEFTEKKVQDEESSYSPHLIVDGYCRVWGVKFVFDPNDAWQMGKKHTGYVLDEPIYQDECYASREYAAKIRQGLFEALCGYDLAVVGAAGDGAVGVALRMLDSNFQQKMNKRNGLVL